MMYIFTYMSIYIFYFVCVYCIDDEWCRGQDNINSNRSIKEKGKKKYFP